MEEQSHRDELAPARRPYEPPTIESEPILEKQLLVICGTFPQPCEQAPPQS